MLYILKDSNGDQIGIYNLGDNEPRDYIGQTFDNKTVASYELNNSEDGLTDRELTITKDEELRALITNLTARVEALENT